jgi:hypothetical protein
MISKDFDLQDNQKSCPDTISKDSYLTRPVQTYWKHVWSWILESSIYFVCLDTVMSCLNMEGLQIHNPSCVQTWFPETPIYKTCPDSQKLCPDTISKDSYLTRLVRTYWKHAWTWILESSIYLVCSNTVMSCPNMKGLHIRNPSCVQTCT